MARTAFRYRGKRISVVEVHGSRHLFINDEHIPTTSRGRSGPYWSKHVPYRGFATLRELAQAIVDYRALDESRSPRPKRGVRA